MENVNTNLEDIFKTLFPTNGLEPEGFCIDARKLHQALQAKYDFSTWVKARVKKLRLTEGFDYIVEKNRSQTDPKNFGTVLEREISPVYRGVKTAIDYKLTLDSAKHFCMAENTDLGYKTRCYFIQAEKALRTLEPELTEEIQQKVLGYNQFLDSSNTCSMAEAAQLLGTGRTRLMKDLRSNRYLKANNTPYQKAIELGYMITKLVPTRIGVITVARVTTKGLDHLRQKL